MKDHLKNIYMQIECDLEDYFESKPKSHEGLVKVLFDIDTLGWIRIETFQQYVEEFENFPPEVSVMLYHEDSPTLIFDHELFQRRKVEGTTVVGPEKSFHLLISGQKMGPFIEAEIKEKLANKEILHTSTASNNNGKTWHKLYDFKTFDRRYLAQENLPTKPTTDVFQQSATEVQHGLVTNTEERQKNDAIAGLAHLGQIKSAKEPIHQPENKESESDEEATKSYLFAKAMAAFAAILIVIGFWQWNTEKKISKQASRKESRKKRNKRVVRLDPIKKEKKRKRVTASRPEKKEKEPTYRTRRPRRSSVSASRNATRRKRRSVSSTGGTSFTDSDDYRDSGKKLMDNPLLNNDEYEDREVDREENPEDEKVEKQLSKEHLERDEEYEDGVERAESPQEGEFQDQQEAQEFEEADAEEEYIE